MRAVVVAALLAMAWPAAAAAADAGGGTAPASVRGYRSALTIVTLRPTAGGTVVVRALVQAQCGSAQITRRVPVAADGSFSLAATQRDHPREEPRARRVANVQIAGRLVGLVASGTATARIKFVLGGRVVSRCGSGRRAWQARGAAPQTVPGPPQPGRGYYGLTGQPTRAHALLVRVGAGGHRVATAVFEYRLTCRRRAVEASNVTPGGPIAADGTFHLRERFAVHYSNAIERFRVKVDGAFTPTGVNGTVSVTSVARSEGRVIDRCRTGAVTFTGAL